MELEVLPSVVISHGGREGEGMVGFGGVISGEFEVVSGCGDEVVD